MDVKTLQNTEPIQEMVQRLGAGSIFGAPTTQNGVVVIPVAQVEFGFGYGGGYGRNGEHSADGTAAANEGEANEGAGSGGGAGGRSTPRGYIRIVGDEVKFEPITDETRIPIAGIVMVAWIVFWVMATIRVLTKAVAKTQQIKATRTGKNG
ncbi:MAG: spore germination protein GerW family protein [Caldilineaceae bacterium]